MIGIYGIFRKSDDKCMYVGQSKDINGRIEYHLSGRVNTKFNSEEYYGEMLEQHFIDDRNYRLEREAYWINELNAEMNVIRDRHYIKSEETKQKISEANKGEKNPYYGKHPSKDIKKKLSKLYKNTKWINNGVITKRVKHDELQQYLENGWVLGRLL